MKNIWTWIKKNPNRTMFLIPIILVAGISISHVVAWYDIANPISWAIYLSIAIEVGAMTALVAAMNKIKGGVWFMFGLVTFVQMIGNIFFSFKEVDPQSYLFKSWIELTGPVWESIGSDINDVTAMKRWLAFLEGGLLPIISLTSLHFFIKYDDGNGGKIKMLDESSNTSNEKIIEKPEVTTIDKVESEPESIKKLEKDEIKTVSSVDKIINSEKENSSNSINDSLNKEVENHLEQSNTNDWKSFGHKSSNIERQTDFDEKITSDSIKESASEPAVKVTPEPVVEVIPEPTVKVTPEPVVEVIPEPTVEVTPEPVVEVIPEPTVEVTPEPTTEPLSKNDLIDNNIPDFVTDTNQIEEKVENTYKVEYIEIPQTEDIFEIPISGNIQPDGTIGKKLSYKRTS